MKHIVLAALLSTLLLTAPALAEGPNCRSLNAAVAEVHDKYHEVLTVRAVSQAGYAILLFANPDGSTWTLFGMLKDGKTVCTLDAGEGLQFVTPSDQPVPAPDQGDPS